MTNVLHSKYHSTGSKNAFYGKKHTAETIEKLRVAHTGMKQSAEAIEKIRIASTGTNNPWYGKHHNDAAKAKMKGFSILWNVYKNNDGTKSYNEFKHAVKIGDITFEMQPISVFID